jgi:hypothetical protein
MLAKITNKYYPGTLPYDISWNLTGLSPAYLEKQEYIQKEDDSRINVSLVRNKLAALATSTPQEYSIKLRELLAK